MTSNVRVNVLNGVLAVTISRPDKMNALSNEMYGLLADAIESAQADKSIRVVLLQAEGSSFTAGNDLSDFAEYGQGIFPEVRHVRRFLHSLASATKPLVAAVQGKAVGVGTTMLLHCDLVVMSDDAQLFTPFVNLGLVPEAASTLLLPARIGYSRAYEMFALGEPVPAALALSWGIVNRVCPSTLLNSVSQEIAEKIATKPAGALAATKSLMRDAEQLMRLIDKESDVFDARLASAEAKEAFAAFAQKRKPNFSVPTD